MNWRGKDIILDVTLAALCLVGLLALIAMLIGVGFEAAKWLGHTQK